MDRAFRNLTQLLQTDTPSWHIEHRFWRNCFKRVQQMSGANRIFKRIANAPKDDLGDYLAEIWYAVVLSEVGFEVEIEPLGKAGPDLRIERDGQRATVEITHFRQIHQGPPEFSFSDEHLILAEYGNPMRDTRKAYSKIVSKFEQIDKVDTNSSIISLWNDDEDLEDIEVREAVRNLIKDATAQRISIPDSLAFILFGPWDGRFHCFPLRFPLAPHEEKWSQEIEQLAIREFKRRVLGYQYSQ